MTVDDILLHGTRTFVSPGRVVIGVGAVEEVGVQASQHGETALLVLPVSLFDDAIAPALSE